MLKTSAIPEQAPQAALENGSRDPAVWARKWLIVFLAVHFAVWIVIPLFRAIPNVDSLEAVIWGEYGGWGTDKHPPVSGWIAWALYRVVGNLDVSVYLASQLCVLTAFIFIYKLALLYVSPDKALLSVMLLEGTRYYSYYSMNYNVNVVSLAVIAVVVYLFRMAVTTDRLGYWLGVGLFGGLALLTKYNNGILLFCLGLFLLLTAEGRSRMRRPGPYAALALAVLVAIPHIVWLYHHDFKPFTYTSDVFDRDLETTGEIFWGTLRKLNVEGRCLIGTFVIFFLVFFSAPGKQRRERGAIGSFLIFAGILPYLLTVAIIMASLVVGHSLWAYGMVGYFPLLLFLRFPFSLDDALRRRAVLLCFAAMLIFAGIHLFFSLTKAAPTYNLDRDEYAAFLRREWEKISPEPLAYVGGGWVNPIYAASFMKERPQMFFPVRSTIWVDEADVEKKGMMVLCRFPEHMEMYKKHFPALIDKGELVMPISNRFGKKKLNHIRYGVLPPAKTEEAGG